MLTISGLGFSNEIAPDSVVAAPQPKVSKFLLATFAPKATSSTYDRAASSPGACAAPNVQSEFGCLTPMVPVAGSTATNTVWGCPAGSQPYNSKYCLMTNDVAAEQQAAAEAAARAAAAEAQAAADAAAKAQADADAAALLAAQQHESEAHQAAADEEAARQQAIADQIAAAAAQAAQDAVDAHMAAQPDGTGPSPGMTMMPIVDGSGMRYTCPDGTVIGAGGICPMLTQKPKSTKTWWLIGGVVGAGILAAFLSR